MFKKIGIIFLIVSILGVLYLILFSDDSASNQRLEKSLSTYKKAILRTLNSDTKISEISRRIGIKQDMTDKEIVIRMSKYFNRFDYKYNMYIEKFDEFISTQKGDCKDFTVAMASLMIFNGRKPYIIVRDKFNDGKEDRVGHVYLAIKNDNNGFDFGNYKILPFEPTPPNIDDKSEDPFERVEESIDDINGNYVTRLAAELNFNLTSKE